ncbi:MAG: glycoside hydrolase family 2, partial [Bacteroides sp.]|nr:glycoside hydrolase family 2 [Bacteroides sp.]
GTAVPIQLDSYESAFIVFRKQANETKEALDIRINYPTPHVLAEFNKGWTVSFDPEKRGPKAIVMDELVDITTHTNDSIKHYSGTIQYENSFELDHKKASGKVFLKAHDLSAMAKVEVNGELVGGFWTAPYQVDITDYITSGRNQIKIEVTTTWVNRIIGDLKLPIEERKTWLTFQPWNKNDGLHKSGLIGPVVIESYDY